MGYFDNIGSTILDVQGGMEYAKANQRRDTDVARANKRADMQDQTAQYGLEDMRRKRASEEADRAAATGAASLDVGLKAQEAARLARGDTAGASEAKKATLSALVTDYQTTEAQFAQSTQPMKQGLEKTALAGQVARQPGAETLANQQQSDQMQSGQEKMIARMWQIAGIDKNVAVKMLSESPVLFQGKRVSDIMASKDGQRIAVVGEDGNPLAMLNKAYLDSLAQKYADPGKTMEVEQGKSLVHVTAGGQAKEIYTARDKPIVGRHAFGPNGEVLNTQTGSVQPGAGINPKRTEESAAKRAALVQKGIDNLRTANGGTLNMGMSAPDADKFFTALGQKVGEFVDQGMPFEAAANKAYQLGERAKAMKLSPEQLDMAAPGGLPAKQGSSPAVDWRNFQ